MRLHSNINQENYEKNNFEKNPCEKKKGKGAKVHAIKKRQGGKTLRSEISALSTFRGCEALPRPPTKKMTKMKNLKKIHARKKKARGQKFMREKKGRGAKLSGQKFLLYRRLGGVRHFPDHQRRK